MDGFTPTILFLLFMLSKFLVKFMQLSEDGNTIVQVKSIKRFQSYGGLMTLKYNLCEF